MNFSQKQLNCAEPVHVRLKAARKAKGFDIAEISKRTKIRPNYIQYLEEGNYDKLPKGSVYKKNIITAYAKVIKADPAEYLFQFQKEEDKKKKVNKTNKQKFILSKTKKTSFRDLPTLIRFIFLLSIGFSSVGYLTMQIQKIVRPPELTLYSPEDGIVTNEGVLEVTGETGKSTFITINGRNIANDGTGKFKENLDLSVGVNTIIVSAKRKHGKSTIITRYVVLKEGKMARINDQ